MKMNGNEIKPGNIIKHQDTLWVAVKCNAVKPGKGCLLYTSPSPRDRQKSRMPSSA